MINTLPRGQFILGEDLPLEIIVTDEDGADLTTATATVTIRDSAGAVIVPAAAMTGSGSTERTFLYLLTTGAAQTITAAGFYRAQYIVTFGSVNDYAYQEIYVTSVPGNAPGGWPNEGDVEARFEDMGLTAPIGNTITNVLNACITAWERITGFQPFYGSGEDETRYYVPSGGKVISFLGGITAAPTSLTINGNYDDDGVYEGGTALVVNRDYTLLPQNALARGKPYTHARVTRYYSLCHDQWASIKVVAPFGYAEEVPADAWEAVMRCALSLLLPSAEIEASGGGSSIKQGPVEWKFEEAGGVSRATDYFMKYEQAVLLGYKMEAMRMS